MPKATSPKPYTGVSIRVQLRPRVHRALKVKLAQEGQTITGWLHAMVQQALTPPTPCPLADDILRQPDVRQGLVAVLRAQESRLDDYADVVALMPPCPHRSHGPEWTAYAREWVCQQRAKELGLWDAAVPEATPFVDLEGDVMDADDVARGYGQVMGFIEARRRLTDEEVRTLATELAARRCCPECQHLHCLHTCGSDGAGAHCNVHGCDCRASTSAW